MLGTAANKLSKLLPSHRIKCFDNLAISCLPYYFFPTILIIGFSLYELTRNSFLLLFIIYGIIPIFDEIFTLDTRNPTESESKIIQNDRKFEIPLYVTVLIDWIIFFYVLDEYSQPNLSLSDLLRLIGLMIVVSNNNAGQFAISHQLLHKIGWPRIVGTVHMLKTLNMHFTYEHVYGHHRRVGTPQDPATAKYNENVYNFFANSYIGAYKSVYQMQRKQGKSFFDNYANLSIIASLVFCIFIYKKYGVQCFMLYLLQVLGAVFYLQVINYIEHYGLKRKKLSSGEYQKITIRHSWNAPHRFSNYLFFKLQRHSDHHENSLKPYQTLLTLDESPQLPHGYIVMTLMALFPHIFKRIMNPLINQKQGNQNIQKLNEAQSLAIQQTRKFIIQAFMCSCAIFMFSCLWIK